MFLTVEPRNDRGDKTMIEPNRLKIRSRDQELLRMLAQGSSNKQIASFLNVTPSSAKQHLRTLFLLLLDQTKTGTMSAATAEPEHRSIGYGLPCSKCRAYYPADLGNCPICGSPDRVSPDAVPPYKQPKQSQLSNGSLVSKSQPIPSSPHRMSQLPRDRQDGIHHKRDVPTITDCSTTSSLASINDKTGECHDTAQDSSIPSI
jgi:DNA-binding CsgD family transcriptional regulator